MANDGRGWHNDPEGHAEAGSHSSGNQGNPQQHARAGRKGGKAAHPRGRGLQNASQRTRQEVARKGEEA